MKKIVVGGRGTGADANDLNGGACDSAILWSQVQGANGAALAIIAGAAVANNGSGSCRITSAGNFGAAVVGVYAGCVFAGTYTSGSYRITAINADYIDIDLDYSADTSADVRVGGAKLTIAGARQILIKGDTVLLSNNKTYTEIDTHSSASAIINLTGWTDTFRGQSIYELMQFRGVAAATGEPDFANPAVVDGETTKLTTLLNRYTLVDNIEFKNSSGPGVAGQPGDEDSMYVMRCNIHNNGYHGVSLFGFGMVVQDCHIHYNNGYGVYVRNGNINGNRIHNNADNGIDVDGAYGCQYNLVYNNGGTFEVRLNFGNCQFNIIYNETVAKTLIELNEQFFQPCCIVNNTLFNASLAGSIGIQICRANLGLTAMAFYVKNNLVIGCKKGIVAGDAGNAQWAITGYNHLYQCDTPFENWPETSTDVTDVDPLVVSVASGNVDLSLQETSPCRNTGFTIGAN